MGDELQAAKHEVQELHEQVCLTHSKLFFTSLSCLPQSPKCAARANADSTAEKASLLSQLRVETHVLVMF